MSLITILIYVGVIALFATAASYFYHKTINILISFLQYFCGFLFIFSGFVKAVDPLGTAFKMEDYFAQFEFVAQGSFLSPIASIFPFLSHYSLVFALFTIVLEILLGIMLVIGSKPKFTAWAFFILMVFFTKLTGFTYLTGYVPADVNFFEFSKWGAFNAGNMKVTDCGCFGDFIVLVPKISFFKDLFLMIPAILFLFMNRKFHRLFTPKLRQYILLISIAVITLFCLYNTYMNEPIIDFRPFKNGTQVRDLRAAELKAAAEVPVTVVLTPKAGGNKISISQEEYAKRWKEFPKTDYNFEQLQGEPLIARTKLSDFTISDLNNQDITENILESPGYTLMVVNYHVPYDWIEKTIERSDTLLDPTDSTKAAKISTVTAKELVKAWDPVWLKNYRSQIIPILNEAEKQQIKTINVFAGISSDEIREVIQSLGKEMNAAEADDKLLKTMIRSNPGIILWKDGKIIRKFHEATHPDWKSISKYLK